MKLWLLSQTTNNGYDTYDSAVVAAETEAEAKLIHPSEMFPLLSTEWKATGKIDRDFGAWTSKQNVHVKLLGEADPEIKAGVICASFNAG